MNNLTRKRIERTGLCARSRDHHLWISDLPENQAKAKSICQGCPVKDDCLTEYFHEAGVVVGGTTWRERQKKRLEGYLPAVSHDRLVESYRAGGLRALQLDANMTEEEATVWIKSFKKVGGKPE